MTQKNKIEKGSKGFLYYAHNNERINYLNLAICSAITGHYCLNNFRATVITDKYSLKTMSSEDLALLKKHFEYIKIDNQIFNLNRKNYRTVMHVFENKGNLPWHNRTRPNAYRDSPYDETILVDVDFIFQDSNLDSLWGSNTPIMMNRKVIPIINSTHAKKSKFPEEEMVGKFTIPLFWATLVYFNRSNFSKSFYNIVNHIHDNYEYYQKIYDFDRTMYRNDFSFSIALHMMNGFVIPGSEFEIPFKFILATTMDQAYRVDKNSTKFIVHTRDWKSLWHMVNIKGISYHCMNKISLKYKYEQFLLSYLGIDRSPVKLPTYLGINQGNKSND